MEWFFHLRLAMWGVLCLHVYMLLVVVVLSRGNGIVFICLIMLKFYTICQCGHNCLFMLLATKVNLSYLETIYIYPLDWIGSYYTCGFFTKVGVFYLLHKVLSIRVCFFFLCLKNMCCAKINSR